MRNKILRGRRTRADRWQMRVTKQAKKVKVKFQKVEMVRFIPEYRCPSCGTTFRGDVGVNKKTIRFRCECGQELICT